MRPYLRVANVFEDRIDVSDVMEMDFSSSDYETYKLHYGDILLNEGQSHELVGRPAMYRDECPGACFTNTFVRFRAYPGVNQSYALKVFLAYLHSGQFQRIATITLNIAHLGAGRFAQMAFPLPRQIEQDEIVGEVERQETVIGNVGTLFNTELVCASRLRQSILKRAFEGRLVPQDPSDEPASVLLGRLNGSKDGNTSAANATVKRRRMKNPAQQSIELQ